MNKVPSSSSSSNTNKIITTINDADILFGCGGALTYYYHHPGNKLFHRIVNENKKRYRNLQKKSNRFILVLSIIMTMENGREGRFLKRKEKQNGWIEVSREEVISKTVQALLEHHDDGASSKSEPAEISRKNLTNRFSSFRLLLCRWKREEKGAS